MLNGLSSAILKRSIDVTPSGVHVRAFIPAAGIEAAAASSRAGFWRCEDTEAVRRAVAHANDAIATANVNLIESDQLPRFDPEDIVDRWRKLRR